MDTGEEESRIRERKAGEERFAERYHWLWVSEGRHKGKVIRMQIFICDDEPQILSNIAERVTTLFPEGEVQLFSKGSELLACLNTNTCDILLLDIDMPEMDGLHVAKELTLLKNKPLLVFVTSHDELVYDSFQYHPYAFLRKSRFEDEIEKVLQDCIRELRDKEQHFCFRSEGNDVCLLLADILYFEAEGNYLKIVTSKEVYRFRSTLGAVENTLQESGFIRIHKGFFVNQAAVKLVNSEEITLQNDMTLPVGKSYSKTVREQMLRYMRA